MTIGAVLWIRELIAVSSALPVTAVITTARPGVPVTCTGMLTDSLLSPSRCNWQITLMRGTVRATLSGVGEGSDRTVIGG